MSLERYNNLIHTPHGTQCRPQEAPSIFVALWWCSFFSGLMIDSNSSGLIRETCERSIVWPPSPTLQKGKQEKSRFHNGGVAEVTTSALAITDLGYSSLLCVGELAHLKEGRQTLRKGARGGPRWGCWS